MRRAVVLLASSAALAGCGSGGGAEPTWPAPATKADGKVSIAGFNDFLAGDGKEFAGSPVAAATEFLRLDQSSAAVTTVVATSPGEVRNFSEVVATLDGLLDDSVRARRYTVELQRDQSKQWRVRDADWAQRCQPGRGHQTFSADPCA